MKKLIKLASFVTLVALGGLAMTASPIDVPGAEDGTLKDYIVTLNAPVGEKGDSERQRTLNEIKYLLDEDTYEITNTYSVVMNGFSIRTDEASADIISSISTVAAIDESHTYAAPESVDNAVTFSAENNYLEEKLGNYSASTIAADPTSVTTAIRDASGDQSAEAKLGQGISIGIIDTGLLLNNVEGTPERAEALSYAGNEYTLNAPAFIPLTGDAASAAKITQETIAESLTGTVSSSELSNYYSYINNKIPFARDYTGSEDNYVNPNPDSAHGTHVASLAGANGEEFQGISPNSQLAVLKVFPDDGSGASDADVIQALEDSAKLHLDVVNLSLGTDLMDDSDTVADATYQAIQGAVDAGVIVNYAAGNSGKASFSSSEGYSDFTTDTVETGILGSSSLLDERANIVASSNPAQAFYTSIMIVDGTAVSYDDQVINKANSDISFDFEHPLTELLKGETSGEFEFVRIGGVGTLDDFAAACEANGLTDLSGKIAVVDRGELQFIEKNANAEQYNALALIVVNDNPSVTFNFSFDFNDGNPNIPNVLVFQNMGSVFGEVNSIGTLTISQNSVETAPDGNIYSSFSNDGPTYDLDINPTIAAPGQSVIGAISADIVGSESGIRGYDNMSGTSMATPNFTGAIASILSEKYPSNGGVLALSEEEYEAYKKNVSGLAMSTANPINDTTGDKKASVRIQGAGNVQVADALLSDAYVTTTVTEDSADSWQEVGDEVSKVELKNGGTLFTDLSKENEAYIEFNYTIHNDSSETRTYTPSISLMIPELREQITRSEYEDQVVNQPDQVEDIPENLPGTLTFTTNDDTLTLDDDHQLSGNLVVQPHSTASGEVRLRIDDIHISKQFDDNNEIPAFEGTLREYFNQYFNQEGQAGGSYVEGFLTLTEASGDSRKDLSLPYMGFYGDYTKGEAVEPFDFEKEEGRLYNSDLVDSYMRGLSNRQYARPNAYTGSYMSSTSAFTATQQANVSNMRSSVRANGTSYLSLEGPDGYSSLYAGATDISDTIAVQLFFNRSLSDATWSIKQNDHILEQGEIKMWREGTNYTDNVGGVNGYYKSMLIAGETGYSMYSGLASIDLSDLDDADNYVLEFNYTLQATKTVQTKTYNLVIDSEAPEYLGAEIEKDGDRQYLNVYSRNGDAGTFISALGGSFVPTLVEGTTDVYRTRISLSNSMLEQDKVHLLLRDYAHNETSVTIHPSSLNTIVVSNDIDNTYDFAFSRLSASGGYITYLFEVYQNGVPADGFDSPVTLYLYYGEDFDLSTFYLEIDGVEVTPSYDAETGYVSITFEPIDGASTIVVNVEPSEVVTPDDPDHGDDGDNTSGNSSSTPNTGDSSSTPGENPEPENPSTSEGLPAWAIALIVVGSLVVVGGVVALVIVLTKKKK